MLLYLINPSNPPVSIVNVKESRWNRCRVWKPLSLMVLAGLTPPDWEIAILDENLGATDYQAMPLSYRVGSGVYILWIKGRFQHTPSEFQVDDHIRNRPEKED